MEPTTRNVIKVIQQFQQSEHSSDRNKVVINQPSTAEFRDNPEIIQTTRRRRRTGHDKNSWKNPDSPDSRRLHQHSQTVRTFP